MSKNSEKVKAHLKSVATKSDRVKFEMHCVEELFSALDNNDMPTADAILDKMRPAGSLKLLK
jgi:hypothetical protein